MIENFRKNPVQILLVGAQIGKEGIDLSFANKIFLYDPWWNPAIE
jgi:SNF2 family DNA or RNA helicase